MEKLSCYNINTSFQNNILIYNTFSNSLICFTADEYEVAESLLQNLKSFNEEYPLLYKEMKNAGFIIDEDFNELEYLKLKNHLCIYEDRTQHLTINPTLDCNLRCWYCSTEYAKAIHNGGMGQETIAAVQKHISYLIKSLKVPGLHLDWFGGEPLMYYDKVIHPIAQHTIELLKEYNIGFTQHATTNSVLMTENMMEDMAKLHFTSFQISLDGNESHHNTIKYYSDKTGTFKDIIKNINLLCEIIPNVNIILRINYDKKTLYGIEEIIPLISECAKKHILVDFQKVWQIQCDEKDKEQLKKVKSLFAENGLNSGFWAYHPKKYNRCYSDRWHHYVINYDGRVFKCTAQNYGDDKVVGKLKQDGNIEWNMKLLSELFSHPTFDNEICLKCKSLPICMGPCIIRNHEARKEGRSVLCVADNVQYTLSSYIIEEAHKRELI